MFNIPAGTKSIAVYVSSETGITSGGGNSFVQGDEDFITISAIIDMASQTSSGYVNYAKNTFIDGSGTNVYGWQNAPLGAFIPVASKIGDAVPDLNNVNFTIAGSTLIITQSETGIHSSFYVQYLSPYNNSLSLLEPQVKALLHGAATANTDLVIPIPAGADIISISGKGTNSNAASLNTAEGSEEGYANLRFTIDLDKGKTNGFVTLANGGAGNRRSTYAISNLSSTYSDKLVQSGAASGDYSGKSTNDGSVGLYNPQLYVSGNNLIIKRDASYARDFDDTYAIEFYKRTGMGMSAEFVSSDIQTIPKGQSSTSGIARTFTIPPGTNAIYFSETGNSVNVNLESNENSLEAYAYIDLATGTASGYFYQQVGLSGTKRRDDNYAFKGVPLDNSSTRSHANTVGFKGPYNYDISFSLSADKSQLTVTNKTDLANPDYQFLLSADYYGSKPDIAFKVAGVTFTKLSPSKVIRTNVAVCNPGAGNSNGGMPVSFYDGDPTVDPRAKLLYTGTFNQGINTGECQHFTFDMDLSSYNNLNIALTIVINDDGSFVPGSVGNTVGTPFTLASLATQHTTHQECYYDNNLLTSSIAVNNVPVPDLDPDNSSGATGACNYLDHFNAGSPGTKIADADLEIIDPDATDIFSATFTLTNTPDAGHEGLFLNGTLPPGITISGNGTGAVTFSGQASQSDYITALQMLEYRNSNRSPNTSDRIILTTLYDGVETGPASTTTIVILTSPQINVTGNANTIGDNSTATSAINGTDLGQVTTAAKEHTFSICNTGTGVIDLTGSPAVSIGGTGDPGFTILTQPAASTLLAGESADFIVRFDPAGHATGIYTAVIRIVNNDPDADRAVYTFTVSATVNNIPSLSDNSISGKEDQTLVFTADNFATAYNDPDGNTLRKIRITSLPLNGSFRLSGTAITTGQEISFSDLGNITFMPGANWNGHTGFSWSASDGISYSTTAAHMAITIVPVNDAPTGTGDARTTPEDVPVNSAVSGADPDGNALTFTKATDPAHGTAVVNADGSYTYTPATQYSGPDHFTITISDGWGGTATVTVNIMVLPAHMPTGIALVKEGTLRQDYSNITYTFTVTNTGSAALFNVTITDPMLGLARTLPDDLQPGATVTVTIVYKLTQADLDRGIVTNTATVKGRTQWGAEATDMSGSAVDNDTPTETRVPRAADLKIPTLFTPNGDGLNDVFEIRGLQQYAENELVIVNRWGSEVYRQKNYENNWRGDGLSEGTYYYLLHVKKDNGPGWEILKGYTTLIRKLRQ